MIKVTILNDINEMIRPGRPVPNGCYRLISAFSSDWWHNIIVEITDGRCWQEIRPAQFCENWKKPLSLEVFRSVHLPYFEPVDAANNVETT